MPKEKSGLFLSPVCKNSNRAQQTFFRGSCPWELIQGTYEVTLPGGSVSLRIILHENQSQSTLFPSKSGWLQDNARKDYCWKRKRQLGALSYFFPCPFFRGFSCVFEHIHCLPVRTNTSIFWLQRQFLLIKGEDRADWSETLTRPPVEGFCFCCKQKHFTLSRAMEMEKGRTSIRRGLSCPGELRKPLQATHNTHTPGRECNASWETAGFNKEQMSRTTSKCLFTSHSLSLFGESEQRQGSALLLTQHKNVFGIIFVGMGCFQRYLIGFNCHISSYQKT